MSEYQNRIGNGFIKIVDCQIYNVESNTFSIIETFKDLRLKLFYKVNKDLNLKSYRIDIGINNILGERITWFSTELIKEKFNLYDCGHIEFLIRKFPLAPGEYNCNIYCEVNNEISDYLINVVPFKIIELDYYKTGIKTDEYTQGNILLDIEYVH